MQLRNALHAAKRRSRFELFEERLALSAQPVASLLPANGLDVQLERHYEEITPVDPVADFHIDVELVQQIETHEGFLTPHLGSTHPTTGVDYVRSTFGFGGQGQTVAIIDSGIAYDHFSLGAGYGQQYRVVGGYDFAENDADPYDDGPAGFHGTHVAGIVGSDHAVHQGVAPDVDLVALRVFDDDGAGFFSWVEDALSWVHDNRDSFANPITTVNMSLGTTWNSDSIPGWSTIDDELAQLEADGIFIAASAGNSFQDYNETGLSYPAASQHLVPVASVGSDGAFSSFSQRDSRIIAAPGEAIVSTVPDHVFGSNGVPDDLGAASGTSMASPYLAGASTLVRQAMDFVGMQGITQDTIYDHLRNTADIFYDTTTSANYHRLNVQTAIDALMPDDDYGSTLAAAHDLGTLGGQLSMNGLIGELTDVDYFSFTAGATGTMTLTLNGDHDLAPSSVVYGASGISQENELTFDVLAGQTYSVSVATADGLGYYDADFELQAVIDLGTIESHTFSDQNLTGAVNWYQLTATRNGVLTVEAFFEHGNGDVDLELYNSSNQLLVSSSSTTDNERVGLTAATAGQTFLLKASGVNNDVDLRATNLVALTNESLYVFGTSGNDTVIANMTTGDLTVNDVFYVDALEIYANTMVYGGDGNDNITVTGSAGAETAVFQAGSLNMANRTDRIQVFETETITVHSGGGFDQATLVDTAANDEFIGRHDTSVLQGTGYRQEVTGFSNVEVQAVNGGYDRAYLYDSSLNDHFVSRANSATMYATGYSYYNVASDFERVDVHATSGGYDRAYMYDSSQNDHFVSRADSATMYASDYSYYNVAHDFERIDGHATSGGYDRAYMHGADGDDSFVARPTFSVRYANDYSFYAEAHGFSQVDAYATGTGFDRAYMYDAATNDLFVGRPDASMLYASDFSFYNVAHNFNQVEAHATGGGYDRAFLYDSANDDLLVARPTTSVLYAADYAYYNRVNAFARVDAYSSAGGNDRAYFHDSAGDDFFVGRPTSSVLYASDYSFYNVANNFRWIDAFASSGGNDQAHLYDTAGNDLFSSSGSTAEFSGNNYYLRARDFEDSFGYSINGGIDSAQFTGVADGDTLVARNDYATVDSSAMRVTARDFYDVLAVAKAGNSPTADIDSVDFFFEALGDWTYQ
jgi:subtilisin family serine protease